jgi:sRNA-binding carbon storage regulator CsrA
MSYYLDVAVGESVDIDNRVRLTVIKKTGRRTRLKFDAPKEIPIQLLKAEKEKSESN